MIGETWRLVQELNNECEVSDHGRVRNRLTGKVYKPRRTKNGYLRIHFKRKDYYIHRLVADAFCSRQQGCDVVNHLDNNPANNNASNLEWVTQRDNVHYGMRQKHYRLNAVPVVGYKDGNKYEYASANQAALYTGCDHSMIIKCCKGKGKTTHGYRWEYAGVSL